VLDGVITIEKNSGTYRASRASVVLYVPLLTCHVGKTVSSGMNVPASLVA